MKNKKIIIGIILLIVSIILIIVGINIKTKEKDANKDNNIVEKDNEVKEDKENLDKNIFKVSDTYDDGKLILSSFKEQKDMYLLQVYNKQSKSFKTDNFTIEYLDTNKELVFRHIISFEIKPESYYSINTKKELDNMNKIEYIRIVEY